MNIDLKRLTFDCTCGRSHSVSVKDIILCPGAVYDVAVVVRRLGLDLSDAVIVYDRNTYDACPIHPRSKKDVILDPKGLHTDDHGIEALRSSCVPARLFVAVGTGTINDIVKIVSCENGVPYICIATACSMDGFVSATSSATLGGKKVTVPTQAPLACVADTDILKKAPVRLSLSGFGDVIGKCIAIADWRLGSLLQTDSFCPTLANMQRDALLRMKTAARGLVSGDGEVYESLMYSLILSGLAMQMFGDSRPAAGAEHYISHSWDMGLFGATSNGLHGEQVGVATLLILKKYADIMSKGRSWFEELSDDPVSDGKMKEMLGSLYAILKKENTPDKLPEHLSETLSEKYDEVLDIFSELPSYEETAALYSALGAKQNAAELGISDETLALTMKYAPLARNRVTLHRVSMRAL